ncbi:hypothetical protein BMS3Bbin11_00361 [bacterium BMS3Bbin11]|nr:hypothetical protein BMS3Abin11_00899 [bacterium BMS3Abin11]GBE45280.1 hypothetical protein BMS3Bbin11_00361 [bacterium BMS3Bbin11]GMT40373.1 MAG: hypothetical protein IEMM0001_1108 [bacterium]
MDNFKEPLIKYKTYVLSTGQGVTDRLAGGTNFLD